MSDDAYDERQTIWTQYGEYLTEDEADIISNQQWIEAGGGYFIGTDGNIIGPGRHGHGRILQPTSIPGNNQHEYVGMGKNKKYVHRIVAEAFLPNPKGYPIVRHKNDDPHDNRLSNLEWGTQSDNIEDMRRNGHMYMKSVIATNSDGSEEIYKSCAEAAKINEVSRSAITFACQGKSHTCNGKRWKYAN